MPKHPKNLSKLAAARLRAGYSQEKAADRLGVAASTVQRTETGKIKATVDQLKAYAELYRVSLADLIDFGHSSLSVPIVGKVAAGAWRDAVERPDYRADDQETVHYMPREHRPIPDGALELEGDSMNEIWPDKTLVFFKLTTQAYEPRDGQRVIVKRIRAGEVETTCKEIQLTGDGQVLLIPRSLNPAHRPVVCAVGEDEEIRIWAVVIDTQQPEQIFGPF